MTVTAGNVLAFGSATGGRTTIDNGATLNVNGIALNNTASKLISISGTGVGGNGAAIVNIGTAGAGQNNVTNLSLTGSSSIGGSVRWDIRGGGILELNGNTLTKLGAPPPPPWGTASTGGPGTINVTSGVLSLESATTPGGGTAGGSINYNSGLSVAFFANTGSIVWPAERGG